MKITTRCSIFSFLLGLSFTQPGDANACSCRGATDIAARFARAQDVVIAEVTETQLVKTVHKEHDLEYIISNIKIIETLKQRPEKTPLTQVIDLVPENGNCSIGLISGMEYVFFVDGHHYEDEESEIGWIKPDNYVGRCTGSHPINLYSINFNEEHAKLKELAKLNEQVEMKESPPCEAKAKTEVENVTDSDKDTILPDNSFRLND